jgi:hypothetical protein
MKILKHCLAWAALAFASAFPMLSHAEDRPQFTILNERFNNIASLDGWTVVNESSPPGQSWFQGNSGIFPAHGGVPSAYIASNFLSAQNGKGWIDNWLITPEVFLYGPSTLSFFTRSDAAPGFRDTLEIRFSPFGSSTLTEDFYVLVGTIGGVNDFPATWQQFIAAFDYEGAGRFAFRYLGDADASSYIGIDSVVISTVPETDIYAMLIAGLAALLTLRRRTQS